MATEKAKEISRANRERLTETILNLMEKDGLDWVQGFDPWLFQARNECTPTRYRGINRMYLSSVMLSEHLADPRFCTFSQAKANGWKVRKGSKAKYVEYYAELPYVFTGRIVDGMPERRWLRKKEAEKAAAEGGDVRWQLCLAGVSAVFNYGDIEGPEPYVPDPPASDLDGTIEALVRSSRCAVHEAAVEAACYRPDIDEIVMPPRGAYGDQARYASTLLHEMAHSTKKALDMPNRAKFSWFGSPDCALEELRAELACIFAGADIGIPLAGMEESHACYLKSWLKACRDDEKAMAEAIADAQRIADYLVGAYASAAGIRPAA